ncbi:zinc finger MIZ domain-containing protein 2-like isoform X2 [Stegodyphus dumicola]|uniref:zinc finger MIZ domain-containing protein 2-like isoform X2 n=1 Tax=Stegodyphus dumicola TaxID=202533 RepID=UPI0015A8AEC6|nr:zinc finger MIZ domain-containing protein 2-like isoform X2 [Stegodyphus dumicola]
MSTYEKWDSQGDFRTQGTFSPMLGAENATGNNNNEFITNELDVAWQTECKIGFNNSRESAGFTFNVYNGSEKEALYSDPSMSMGGWQQSPSSGPPPSGPPQGAQQQLSVVTTVWGVATTTQSGPLAHSSFGANTSTTIAPMPYAQGAPQSGYPANGGPPGSVPSKPYQAQSMNPRQTGPGYSNYNANPSQMNSAMGPNPIGTSGHNSGSEFQSSSSALSAAALVAAAATATATATASVVALQERQQQEVVMNNQYSQSIQSQQFQPGYSSHHQRVSSNTGVSSPLGSHMNSPMGSHMGSNAMMNMPNNIPSVNPMNNGMGINGPMGMNKGAMGLSGQPHPSMYSGNNPAMAPQGRTRASPYPNPQQHMAQKRPGQYGMMSQQYGPGMQSYSPNPQQNYNSGQGCVCCSQYPGNPSPAQYGKQQQYNPQQQMSPAAYPSQQQMRSSLRPQAPPYGNQPSHYYHQSQLNGAPPQTQYDPHYTNQYTQPNIQRNMNYQSLPIPGNPTPPLTPASVVPPYLSPNADIKPNFSETKPPLPPPKDDELRLTFPVRDGIILAPFRLEHNLAVSNHVFHLKPSVHQTLMWRTDLELQLKCFHHEDRQMNTNWPASVQVSVNATPLSIDRGENKASHKPLYLKEVCQPGRNTIQITVTACCCSHLFLLQLVHRPTVRSVLQGLLRKRLLPADHCVAKIKRNFSSAAASNNALNMEDGVEQTAIKVSLKCPITFKRITLPARGQECKHIQCFDLESYLQLNCERGAWRCPVCNKPALLEGLEVDQYIWGILTNLSNSDVEEVTIDGTASWKPVPIKAVKEENDGAIANGPVPNGPMMPNGSNYGSGGYEFQSQATDFSSPLSHLNESVSSLDPLAAMEKSLNHHEQQMGLPNLHEQGNQPLRQPATTSTTGTASTQPSSMHQTSTGTPGTPSSNQSQNLMQHGPNTPHTPHTPHTPGNSGGGSGGPPSVPPPSSSSQPNESSTSASGGNNCTVVSQPNSQASTNSDSSLSHAPDLGDLNFDPAAVIEGEGQGQEGLNLLPESVVDPMELLSYLDPPELSGSGGSSGSTSNVTSGTATSTTATSSSGNTSATGNDDLLALFES